jgi:hypothetical protein
MLYKIAIALFFVYFLLWTQFEGNLRNVAILGTSAALLGAWTVWRRYLRSRTFSRRRFAVAMSLTGLFTGLAAPALALLGMAVKQGLHGHGPEYTTVQVTAVTQSFLWAGVAGLLFGIAAGLLLPVSAEPPAQS